MSDKPNLSLQKKSAARMAAVQALYQYGITSAAVDPPSYMAEMKKRLVGNKDEQRLVVGAPVEPHYPLATALISGTLNRLDEVNARLDETLSGQWNRSRMSHVLVAILQCGIYEMFFYKDQNHRILIDEYTRLSRHFFDEAEVNFVHGALSTLAASYG